MIIDLILNKILKRFPTLNIDRYKPYIKGVCHPNIFWYIIYSDNNILRMPTIWTNKEPNNWVELNLSNPNIFEFINEHLNNTINHLESFK